MAENSLTPDDACAAKTSATTANGVSADERRAAVRVAFADGIRLATLALGDSNVSTGPAR